MINLYGSLARAFKKKYRVSPRGIKINPKSGLDLMQGMSANFKGFRELIKRQGEYALRRGDSLVNGKPVTESDVEMTFSEKTWHIMPVASGCKDGVLQTIGGIVLAVVGAVVSAYVPGGATIGGTMMKVGFAMALGGVAQMLFPSAASDYGATEAADERPSYLFDGPVNSNGPGAAISLAFGKTWIGTHTVSAGMTVTDA